MQTAPAFRRSVVAAAADCQSGGDEPVMTQELVANTPGVRRERVSEAAGRLQSEGLIAYKRGHIKAQDRARLEQRVCECYAVVKK